MYVFNLKAGMKMKRKNEVLAVVDKAKRQKVALARKAKEANARREIAENGTRFREEFDITRFFKIKFNSKKKNYEQ